MECSIDKNEVLRYLGYRGQCIDKDLIARLDEVIEQCESDLQPKGTSVFFDIEHVQPEGDPCITLVNTDLVLEGASIQKHLAGSQRVAAMAVTLGARSEQELRRLSSTDPVVALLYDASCSAFVESAAEATQQNIAEEMQHMGYEIGKRYSPGYGDFPLAMQPTLLRALEANKRLGITVTEGNLLLPSKSITAVVGLKARSSFDD